VLGPIFRPIRNYVKSVGHLVSCCYKSEFSVVKISWKYSKKSANNVEVRTYLQHLLFYSYWTI